MGIYTQEEYKRLGEEGIIENSYEEYHATVYTFYDLCQEMLNHSRICAKCGERVWVGYTDGHVYDHCFSCPPTPLEWDGSIAGYVTSFPVPKEPLPDYIEFRQHGPLLFIDGTSVDGYNKFMYKGKECGPHYTPIEGYYRMKVKQGKVTAIRHDPALNIYHSSDDRVFQIDEKFEVWIGCTEVKHKCVKHNIQVGDIVEYNLGNPQPRIARKITVP